MNSLKKAFGPIFLMTFLGACGPVFKDISFESLGLQKEEKSSVNLKHVVRPIGLSRDQRQIESSDQAEAIKSVNAIYYFLVAEHLKHQGSEEESHIALLRAMSLDEGSSTLWLFQAEVDLKEGRFTEGISRARKILEQEPRHRDAKLLLANLNATAKKYSDARILFSELRQEYPEDEEITLYLALVEIEEKNLDRAFSLLSEFVKTNPEAPLAHFYMGRIEQEKGRMKRALDFYKKAVDLRPGFIQAGTYLGFLQEELGDKTGALETYSWLADQTDDSTFFRKLSQLYLDSNAPEKALAALENLERVEPSDMNVKLRLGLLELELGRLEKAAHRLKQIVKASPESENIRFYLGAVLEDLKDYPESLKQYEKVSPESKLYFDALKRRIFLYGKLDFKNDGLDALKKWEDGFEMNEDYYEAAALFHDNRTLSQTNESLETLEVALKKFPQSQNLLYLKASLLEKRDQKQKALEVMKELLVLNPNHAGALNFVGYLWADQGIRLFDAESYIRRALKFRPRDPFIRDSLAWVHYRKGEYMDAHKILLELKKEKPDEPVILEHLADVLVKLGSLGEAKHLYETALQLEHSKESDRRNIQSKLVDVSNAIRTLSCLDRGDLFEQPSQSRSPASLANCEEGAESYPSVPTFQLRHFKTRGY
jgi:tetratricopeptide (TPR) repeat protein